MSFAHYFRIKAELYGMLLERGDNNAVDRAWYEGLTRSYNLLAASEDRHYYCGLKEVGGSTDVAPAQEELPELEAEIARLLQQYGLKKAA